jgi:hypothetical protein
VVRTCSFAGSSLKIILVGRSPSGKAPGFELGIRRFKSYPASHFFSESVVSDFN